MIKRPPKSCIWRNFIGVFSSNSDGFVHLVLADAVVSKNECEFEYSKNHKKVYSVPKHREDYVD